MPCRYGYESVQERWLPIHTPESILLSVISMLSSPNDESPANVRSLRRPSFICAVTDLLLIGKCRETMARGPCSLQETSEEIRARKLRDVLMDCPAAQQQEYKRN